MTSNNPPSIVLSSFTAGCAAEIASWANGQEETVAWAGDSVTFPLSPDQILRWQTDPDVNAFVGYLDKDLVAYGELWVDETEDEIELARIIVHPNHRRRGIGRSFVALLVSRAASFNLSSTIVRVLSENSPAIRCYEAAGFTKLSIEEQAIFNRQQASEYVWLRYGVQSNPMHTQHQQKDQPE